MKERVVRPSCPTNHQVSGGKANTGTLWKAANIQLIILGGSEHEISSLFYVKASSQA